jgi:hypothetical protein
VDCERFYAGDKSASMHVGGQTLAKPELTVRTVEFELQQWKVVSMTKAQMLQEIKDFAMSLGVCIIVSPSHEASTCSVKVEGALTHVNQISEQFKDLKKLVHVTSKTLNYSPGLWVVLRNLEDSIRVLEHDYNIAVSLCAIPCTASSNSDSGKSQIAFTALVNQCHIEVCFGDFTHHPSASTLINIMLQNTHQHNLGCLVEAGGRDILTDVMHRMKELALSALPQVFETKPHNLKVKKLVHCVVLKWNRESREAKHVLEEGLSCALSVSAPPCVVIFPTTLTSVHCPSVAIAEAIMKAAECKEFSGFTFAMYVSLREEANAIEQLFRERSVVLKFNDAYQLLKSSKGPDMLDNIHVRFLHSKLPSFLSVVNGDLFEQKVYFDHLCHLTWADCGDTN